MRIIFATNNENKLKEVSKLLENNIRLITLKDIHYNEEIPETGITLKANALQKAKHISNKFKLDCFADDTGLEINALDGNPGVYSARYAGEEKIAANNIRKVLNELKGKQNRLACFKTVIALILNDDEYFFEGKIKGNITEMERGKNGFGYDPIFIPEGYNKTFAEMSLEEKNKISHRGIAVQKLTNFLNTLHHKD